MPSRHPAYGLTRVGAFPERRRGCAKTRPGHLAPAGSRVEALIDFARTRSSRGDDVCAIRALRRALRKDPRHAEAAFELGVSLSRLGDCRQSVRAFERAAGLDPRSARARREWGLGLVYLNRPDEAEAPLHDAVRLDPDDGLAWRHLGEIEHRRGRAYQASRCYRRSGSTPRMRGRTSLWQAPSLRWTETRRPRTPTSKPFASMQRT